MAKEQEHALKPFPNICSPREKQGRRGMDSGERKAASTALQHRSLGSSWAASKHPHFCFPDVFHCQAEQEQSALVVLCSTDTLLPCSSKGKAKLKLDLGNLKSPQVSEIKVEQLPKAL